MQSNGESRLQNPRNWQWTSFGQLTGYGRTDRIRQKEDESSQLVKQQQISLSPSLSLRFLLVSPDRSVQAKSEN